MSTCATAAAYVPLFPFSCAPRSAVHLHDPGGMAAGRRSARAARHSVTLRSPRWTRPRRRRAARPLRRRGRRRQRSAAASTPCGRRRQWRRHWPAPTRRRFGPAPTRRTKGPPEVAVGLDVQRCAGVDERIDGRQMAVVRRPVQRRVPSPVQYKGGGGVGVAQGVTPTQRSRCVTALRPKPGFSFLFLEQPAARVPGVLAVLGHTARRTCRRTNRESAKSDGERVCEPTAPRKNLNFGQVGMGTHSSRTPKFFSPSRSISCMQPNYWTIWRGAPACAVDSARVGPGMSGSMPIQYL